MAPREREDSPRGESGGPLSSFSPSSSLEEPLLTAQQQEQQLQSPSPSSPPRSHDDSKDIHILLPCRRGRFSMNHNVLLNLVVCFLLGIADSLWTGTVIAAYLKKLGHERNSWVGNVEAASGLASLFSALPVGYWADTVGRSVVLKWGGALLLVTAILHAWLMEWIGTDDATASTEHKHVELYLGLIMALWGVGGGIVSGPAQALYADSTPKGNRSLYYVYLFTCYQVASSLGPLVSIILFQTLGDDWDLYDLRLVIYVGLGLEVVNSILVMFFDDQKALDEDEIEVGGNSGNERAEETDNVSESPLRSLNQVSDEEQAADGSSAPQSLRQTQTRYDKKRQAWVPYIIFGHSVIFALGSGMTVKFFPLFFKDEVGMSPSQVQAIYVLVPLVLAFCSGLGQSIASRGLGRVPTAMLFKTVGVSGLYSMVFFKKYLARHPFLLVPIYVLRTSLMNASYPLEESILMDFVPKAQRARWKSLESIASFGWCGSAAIGGWLTDHAHGDYTFTFLITAIIQSVGIIAWSLLWPLVPVKEGDGGETETTVSNAVTSTVASDTTLQSPLLVEQSAALREALLRTSSEQ